MSSLYGRDCGQAARSGIRGMRNLCGRSGRRADRGAFRGTDCLGVRHSLGICHRLLVRQRLGVCNFDSFGGRFGCHVPVAFRQPTPFRCVVAGAVGLTARVLRVQMALRVAGAVVLTEFTLAAPAKWLPFGGTRSMCWSLPRRGYWASMFILTIAVCLAAR